MPGVAAVEQLNALQSALGLIGTSLFLLQAFRVNSSYGARIPSHLACCRQRNEVAMLLAEFRSRLSGA